MSSIFARANANLNLTPGERAFLRLLDGVWSAALVAALPIVADALNQTNVNWATVTHAAIAAASTAVAMTVLKYAKAQGDSPLPAPSQPDAPVAPPAPAAAEPQSAL